MIIEKERERGCKFCGKRVPIYHRYDNHDSFWNDLVICEDDSPVLVKKKMELQDRLKFHDIFSVYKKYPVPREWSKEVTK